MEVIVLESSAETAKHAARIIVEELRENDPFVLGLATGTTMRPIYDLLASHHHARTGVTFSHVTGFMLDEYVGLPDSHAARYDRELRTALWDRVDADPLRLITINGSAPDFHAEAERYEKAICEAGGINVQLLGIGVEGHVGFNEAGSSLGARTRLKTLAQSTRQANQAFFPEGEVVPIHAITQGIGTILEAQRLLLVATGVHKSRAVAAAVEGPISASVPASAIQLHRHVTVVVDRAAASELSRLPYYQWEQAHKLVP